MSASSLLVLVLLAQSNAFIRTQPPEAAPHCLYWNRPTLEWRMDTLGNPDTPGETEDDAIRRSFAVWQEVFDQCGNLDLVEGEPVVERTIGFTQGSNDNRNVVLFRTRRCVSPNPVPSGDACRADGSCANKYDCWAGDSDVIAITLTTFSASSGVLFDADIEMNAAPQPDGRRYVFSATEVPSCGAVLPTQCIRTDIQNTVTHEVGHFLGLDHTPAVGSVMNARAGPGDTDKRLVDPGSADFVCTAYPRGRPSQDCVDGSGDGDGNGGDGGGCAGGGMAPAAAGAWAALTAWTLWRRSRRPRS